MALLDALFIQEVNSPGEELRIAMCLPVTGPARYTEQECVVDDIRALRAKDTSEGRYVMAEGWIAMADRQPDLGVRVLLAKGDDCLLAMRARYDARKDAPIYWVPVGWSAYDGETDFEPEEATHWMAVPALPGR